MCWDIESLTGRETKETVDSVGKHLGVYNAHTAGNTLTGPISIFAIDADRLQNQLQASTSNGLLQAQGGYPWQSAQSSMRWA